MCALAAAAGLLGTFVAAALMPADLLQYFGHLLRVIQKLAYFYGWEDFFSDSDDIDDETLALIMTLFAALCGVTVVCKAIHQVAERLAIHAAKQLPKKALTKGAILPIVRRIAKQLEVRMVKDVFAKGVARTIPVVGAAISGGPYFCDF